MHISRVGHVRRAELCMCEYHRAHHSTKGWDRTEQWGLMATNISCWMLTWEFKVFSSFPVTTVPLPVIGAALDLLVDVCRTHRWITCDVLLIGVKESLAYERSIGSSYTSNDPWSLFSNLWNKYIRFGSA